MVDFAREPGNSTPHGGAHSVLIGIRGEDKNEWERRAPLTPDHVHDLVARGIPIRVEPSTLRVFPDARYVEAGATLDPDLASCDVILGVKEVPVDKLLAEKTYLFFSHVIKGQQYNMPMLRRLLDLGCTLIDYEPITDERGDRLIFFGRHAGYAGMIDTLWALGRRLQSEGISTPFAQLRPAHGYANLEEALAHIARVGDEIRHHGMPTGLRPVVVAFTGSGNVSQGAQEVFDRLPWQPINARELTELEEDRDRPHNLVYKCVLEKEDRYRRIDGGAFAAPEYSQNPTLFTSSLEELLPHITVFVNGIYWEPGQPKLITREMVRRLWSSESQPKLRVIGDITCDVGGSIEVNVRATDPGDPVYVWNVNSGEAESGVEARGPVVMAVDNLPCELPADASAHFGDSLVRFVPRLARCDWTTPLDALDLPEEIRRAVITHRGELAPRYRYLDDALAQSER